MATLQSQLVLSLRDQVSGRLGAMSKQLGMFQARMRSVTAPLTGITGRLAAFGGGYLAVTSGYRGTVKAAMDFEDQMAEVRKVLDPTPEQFKRISGEILNMSKRMSGIKAGGLAEIMAEAGQAGIAAESLNRFTEFTAKAAVAFDTTARETGNHFAKMTNVFQFSQPQLEAWGDTVNHLSNNMAAKAGEIIDFTNRAAGAAKPLGLAAEDMSAFGTAMIALGSVPETAGRGMDYFGRMVTQASTGDKKITGIFSSIGINFKEWNKLKKENGPKAMMQLFNTMKTSKNGAKAMIDLFGGNFSKDFAKLVDRPELLAEAFGLAADKAKVAGSVQAEYVNKVDTAQMKLSKLGNNITALGISIGSNLLAPIGNAAAYLTDVLNSLESRVTVFHRFKAAFDGFVKGLGFESGSLSGMMSELRDFIFGVEDGSAAADQYGLIFKRFHEWGAAVRDFSDAVKDNPVVKFLGEMAGQGFKLMLAATGIGLLAGAVGKLGRAMWMLSGAGLAVGILKSVAGIGGAVLGLPGLGGNGKAPKPGPKAPKGAPGAPATGGVVATILRQIATRVPQIAAGVMGAYGAQQFISETSADNAAEARRLATPRDAERDSMDALARQRSDLDEMREERNAKLDKPVGFFNSPAWGHVEDAGNAVTNGLSAVGSWLLDWDRRMSESFPSLSAPGSGGDAKLVPEIQSLRDAIHQPSGTQNVKVTNPTPVHAPISVTVYATTNADPAQIANQVGARVQSTIQGSFSDGGGGW